MSTKPHSKGKYHHLPCQWEFKVKKEVRLNREKNVFGQLRIGYNFASEWCGGGTSFLEQLLWEGKPNYF